MMTRLLAIVAMMFFLVGTPLAWVKGDTYENATALYQNEISASYFGMHFHRLVINKGENKPVTKWPEQLVGSIRLWDTETRWADIAPGAGQWKFDRMDAYVEQAARQQAAILYVLGSTPRWASARPEESCPYGQGCAAEPVRMAHWEEYGMNLFFLI